MEARELDPSVHGKYARLSLAIRQFDSLCQRADMSGSQLFASVGKQIAMRLLDCDPGTEGIDVFNELSSKHRETVYGKYARAVLAIRRTADLLTLEGRTDKTAQAVEQEIEVCAREFPAGHPIRNRLVLVLATLLANQSDTQVAQGVLLSLVHESRDSGTITMAERLLSRLRNNTARE